MSGGTGSWCHAIILIVPLMRHRSSAARHMIGWRRSPRRAGCSTTRSSSSATSGWCVPVTARRARRSRDVTVCTSRRAILRPVVGSNRRRGILTSTTAPGRRASSRSATAPTSPGCGPPAGNRHAAGGSATERPSAASPPGSPAGGEHRTTRSRPARDRHLLGARDRDGPILLTNLPTKRSLHRGGRHGVPAPCSGCSPAHG